MFCKVTSKMKLSKMGVFKFTAILIAFSVCQTNGIYYKTYDWTYLLNAVRSGYYSVKDFVENVNVVSENQSPNSFKLYGLYAPDCKIWNCEAQINDVVRILHNAQPLSSKNVDIILQFKFSVDIETLLNLKLQMNRTKLSLLGGKYYAHFTIPDDTICKELEFVTESQWEALINASTWFSSDSLKNIIDVGFGFNEDLIGCYDLYPIIRISSYLLTSMNFGNPPGVVESYGMFRRKIDYLHSSNMKFLNVAHSPSTNFTEPYIDYYPTTESLGDENHRRLLNLFWQNYVTHAGNRMGAITPMPLMQNEPPAFADVPLAAYFDDESCYFDRAAGIPWTAPSAWGSLSKIFDAAVLTHVEWKNLMSNLTRIYYKLTYQMVNHSSPFLKFTIDFSDWLGNSDLFPEFTGCGYNWTEVESELLSSLNKISTYPPLANARVTTLLFDVENQTAENKKVRVDSAFAKRVSSQLIVGCGFYPNSFAGLNITTALAVVGACKNVNGSLYVLRSRFKLGAYTRVVRGSSRQYEEDVRPKLEEMKNFRNEILELHPQATVFFQIRSRLVMTEERATVFCSSEALSLHEYIGAILSWAVINRVPFIIGRAFDDNRNKFYQTWFSVLKPTVASLQNVHPYFVYRNYPQLFRNMVVEPCIKWTVERPTISESYFHNNYLGLEFFTSNINKIHSISTEEYQILLQLFLHRFRLVRVVVDRETYKNFLTAFKSLAISGLIGPTHLIIGFDSLYATEKEKLETFQEFLTYTKLTLESNITLIKGVDFSWGTFSASNWSKDENLNLTTHRNTMLLGWGESLSLNMGVTLTVSGCEATILDSFISNSLQSETNTFLNLAQHIVCQEVVVLSRNDNTKSLGKIFDSHLYIKKAFNEFHPHLNLYFQMVVDVSLSKDTMHDYLILLSHFKSFAAAYNISYFFVSAFDVEGYVANGWWKISNFSNLSLPSVYEEKYSAYVGSETWRPPLHPKQASSNTKETRSYVVVVVIIVAGLVLIILALGFGLWYYKNKTSAYLSDADESEFRNGKKGNTEGSTSCESEYVKFDSKFELAFADISIDPKDILGRGNFGTVYKGLVKEKSVALKRPNENCSVGSFKSVLCEITVLCYIGTNANVIQFVGAYTKEIRKGILYIATELCSNGSLLDFLRTKKKVVSNLENTDNEAIGIDNDDTVDFIDLHRFSKEIASGMGFISGKNVIHGDLSARNVLLDENFTCKIGDFGLSRKLYEYLEYVKKSSEPIPWKWMAFEGLKNMKFTSKSDVWSYGVTIWEIYSLGSVPYGGLSWSTGFTDELQNGLRLQVPEFATQEIYKTMTECWNLDADERPKFDDLVDFFKQLTSSEYTVLDL